jgi:hypothetical protein
MAAMDTHLSSPSPVSTPAPARPALSLAPGAVHRREIAAGATLAVLAGRLWVTLDGDADDHFIAAGQRWTAPRAGRCVIQGDAAGASVWRWLA